MTTEPTRPEQTIPPIQSVTDAGGVYQVLLQDGTTLWVPPVSGNNDYVHIEAWMEEE